MSINDIAMVVPWLARAGKHLHGAHAALHQPAGNDQRIGIRPWAIKRPGGGGFPGKIKCLGGFGLHAEGHFKRLDA